MLTELTVKIFASFLAIAIGICSYMYFKLPHDNSIEQASETVMTKTTI